MKETISSSGSKSRLLISILPVVLAVIILLLALTVAMVFTGHFHSAEGENSLSQFRISYTDSGSRTAAALKQLAGNRFGVTLKDAKDSSECILWLSATEEEAQALGYDLSGLEEKGFLMIYSENELFLFARSEAGLNRACVSLLSQYTDDAGNLTLSLGERILDTGADVCEDILIGGTSIQNYTILASDSVSGSLLFDLNYYICMTSGVLLSTGDDEDGSPHILLSITNNDSAVIDTSADANSATASDSDPSDSVSPLFIADGDIYLTGSDETSLSQAICQFANTYLDWMFAGTSREQLTNDVTVLNLPSDTLDDSSAWMEEREATITLWNTNYARGVYYNNSTSLKTDIMSFSDEQLYEYVRMLKYCGFTGIQLTDMCSAWACAGSYEYVHERLRYLADAAHSLDMNVTLWVWGSEFTGYGWVDNSVTYDILDGTTYVYENPYAVSCFEKYYSIYAELADCADRIIMHFYDPGNLGYTEDVAYFSKMFYDKVMAVNPDLNFGVSCYVDVFDKEMLVETLGTDITIYEQGHHDNEEDYVDFREFIADSGVSLGTWAWNTCEMEIDQLASLYFNPHIIQSTYQTARKYDSIAGSEYWSEMDSNHVVNVFSLYCAARLLIDPDQDIDSLVHEIALATVGEEYANVFADILYLIEDARSGESWDTYSWSSENYILTSDDYDAEDILARSITAIAVLEEMIEENLEANTLPLPLSLNELLKLMIPYIRQIQEFAQFKIDYAGLESMQADGAPAEEIQAKINSISTPISEYNTVTGTWGQIEARVQQEMLREFCSLYDYSMPTDAVYDRERKFRIYSQFVTFQKGMDEPYKQYAWYFRLIFGYGESELNRLVNEMVAEGILTKDTVTGEVYLTDWEHYIYAFN